MRGISEYVSIKSGLTGKIVKESWQKYKIRTRINDYYMDMWVNKVYIVMAKKLT